MSRDYDTIMLETDETMQKVADHLAQEFIGISAGRSSPAMLANIRFDYYGAVTPLSQAAQITTPDASTLMVKPYDASQLKVIVKAIVDANLGLAPSDDGKVIVCRLPAMTQENRERIAKQLKEIAEKAKVSIRNARHEAIKHADAAKSDSILTEDTHHDAKEEIQKHTNEYNKKIDEMLNRKTEEVMKV